jgi:hypothetical protein
MKMKRRNATEGSILEKIRRGKERYVGRAGSFINKPQECTLKQEV